MRIERYLGRIGFAGAPAANLETLRAMHRGHALRIPYENLDVQLGRPVSRDPTRAFEKIVEGVRGGWCFEMNGVFSAALDAVGFRVRRLAGAVMREMLGDDAIGNHLVILVDLDETYL
ncbi:MAG: arylamine N-acetyltransferase, partial [Parvularculaceae bacterium]|nr:arylamine N-acetyltransferase [Parvularculaceae bacterium]